MRQTYLEVKNKLLKLKDVKNKASISIFLFCLVISIFIWSLIKMSKDYSSDIKYELNFSNPPSNQIISDIIDSIVYIQIDSRGFDLANRLYLKKTKPLSIDLARIRIHENDLSSRSYLLSESLLPQIRNQYEFPNYITRIYPDTLYLKLEKTISKEVGIKLQIEVIPKQQHYIYGNISTSLQKTTIIGPQSIIDSIDFILTEHLKLENIQKDEKLTINLINPFPEHKVRLSDNTIEVLIPIQQYTENSINIPIQINQSQNLKIKLFPESVNVKYLVALKDFERISMDMFSASIQYDPSSINFQKVVLDRVPNLVKIVSYEPETVEYLILMNND